MHSRHLGRPVVIDCYGNALGQVPEKMSLLLINDGQDLASMDFESVLKSTTRQHFLQPLLCVGIHCGPDRKNEYGMIHRVDFMGRGGKAARYRDFLVDELLPYLDRQYQVARFPHKAIAGFSLGGLSALDLAWNLPGLFRRTGVFSGSLWWRSVDKNHKSYHESTSRLMHQQIRSGDHQPGLHFFFQCGELDELEDRNGNGVIDSIDDTIDLLRELLAKGYREGSDFCYMQMPDGRHDVASWAKAFPAFLKWGWGQ